MTSENRPGINPNPSEPMLPAIRNASDILTPAQRKGLNSQLREIHETGLRAADAVRRTPLF